MFIPKTVGEFIYQGIQLYVKSLSFNGDFQFLKKFKKQDNLGNFQIALVYHLLDRYIMVLLLDINKY